MLLFFFSCYSLCSSLNGNQNIAVQAIFNYVITETKKNMKRIMPIDVLQWCVIRAHRTKLLSVVEYIATATGSRGFNGTIFFFNSIIMAINFVRIVNDDFHLFAQILTATYFTWNLRTPERTSSKELPTLLF